MTQPRKFYVVWKGRRTGIFTTWDEASAQVNGFAGAQFKAFKTRGEAERALAQGKAARAWRVEDDAQPVAGGRQLRLLGIRPPLLPSYSVDAACRGNPGALEYRCVKTDTREIVFVRGPFPQGTNNIGEFLGIVEALMLLRERNDTSPIYSDSRNALAWVKAKQCKTQLVKTARNAQLFKRIRAAEEWLRVNTYPNKLFKWRTDAWGEIPADYGRK